MEFKWSPFINYQRDIKAVSSKANARVESTHLIAHVKTIREYGVRVARMFARGEVSGSKSNKLFHHRQLIDPEINET